MKKMTILFPPKNGFKILLVIDQYDSANNGTTVTAQRLASGLCKLGYSVSIVCIGGNSNAPQQCLDAPLIFPVKPLKLPYLINSVITSQGMQFASPDENRLRSAIQQADIVHFIMPFWLSIKGVKIARELGVAHTAAFHVQPENITYTLRLGKAKLPNLLLYNIMRNSFFKYFRHIHCPSNFIAKQLQNTGYKAKLHVISNGILPCFVYNKNEKPPEFRGRYVILMIGRFSKEKRQDILLDAVLHSKYADKIQLIFAGKGPEKKRYERLADKLRYKPIFSFYSQEELLKVISYCDLYVHTADAEIEAISCIEAFSSGLVPIIADSIKSATPQFALDDRSLFTAGDSTSLAEKIDYWLDHPDERKKQEYKYAEYGKKFAHDICVGKMVEMFKEEMHDFYCNKKHIKPRLL